MDVSGCNVLSGHCVVEQVRLGRESAKESEAHLENAREDS